MFLIYIIGLTFPSSLLCCTVTYLLLSSLALAACFSRDESIKERLFTHHPCMAHLAEVLFKVFVSIEMTGESVQFEQKLSYRQPMYKVIDYIWKIDVHKRAIVVCVLEALPACLRTSFPP